MKRKLQILITAAALALPAMAAAQDVKVDYDKAYDFAKLKTFAVRLGTPWGNQLGEDRVKTIVAEGLVTKGWKQVSEDSADTIAVIHGASQTKHTLNTFYDGYGGWGYNSGFGSSTTTTSEYRVGTLVVDIFERPTKKLLFRGNAQAELSDKAEKNQKKAEKAVTKMFKDFPPKPAKPKA